MAIRREEPKQCRSLDHKQNWRVEFMALATPTSGAGCLARWKTAWWREDESQHGIRQSRVPRSIDRSLTLERTLTYLLRIPSRDKVCRRPVFVGASKCKNFQQTPIALTLCTEPAGTRFSYPPNRRAPIRFSCVIGDAVTELRKRLSEKITSSVALNAALGEWLILSICQRAETRCVPISSDSCPHTWQPLCCVSQP